MIEHIPDPNARDERKPIQYIPIPDGFVEDPSGPVESRVVVENNAAIVFPMSLEEVDAVFGQFRRLAIRAMDNPIPKTIDANDPSSEEMPPDPIASWDKENHGAPTPAEINQLQTALESTMQRLITVNERLKNFPSPTEEQFKAVPPTPRDGGTGLANLVPELRITELSNLFTVMEKVAYVAKVIPEIQTEFPAVPTEKDVRILEERYDIIRRRLANYEDAERAQ